MPNEKIEDLVDLEDFAKKNNGAKPPKAKKYRIKIDKEKYTVEVPSMTGREILAKAGMNPVERYQLNQKKHGGKIEVIGLDQSVDFTEPGIERFMTLPMDQNEG